MTHLLKHWLNHELQLSAVVTDIDCDFASGYLFGEVLYQLNHQHNFTDFMNSNIADAKIINFCLLEPSLRSMGVPLDATTATAIMNGTKGTAASVLYQIKMAASRLGRAPGVSTKSLERKAVLPLANVPTKLAKPAYDAENHALFEHAIRRHVKSLATLQQERDALAAEKRTQQAHMRHKTAVAEQLQATKAERLHRAVIHSHYIKEALDETDSPAWRTALATMNAREQRKAHFYQQQLAQRAKQQENHTYSLRQTVERDLDDFETRREPNAKRSAKDSRLASLSSHTSTGYGLRSLSTALEKVENAATDSLLSPTVRQGSERSLGGSNVTDGDMARDASAIKEQKHRREQRKQLLTRRRKRFAHECARFNADLGVARVQVALSALVTRATHSEQHVQRDIALVLAYKDVARENRAARTSAYDAQQQWDAAGAIARDASRYDTLVLRFDDDSETQLAQQQLLDTATQAAAHYAHTLLAIRLVHAIVDLALVVAREREDTLFARSPTVFLPDETWSEYKVQFAHSDALVAAANRTNDEALLSMHELRSYLASVVPPLQSDTAASPLVLDATARLSPWAPRDAKFVGAVDRLVDCVVLGEEIKFVRWMRAAEVAAAATAMPSVITGISSVDVVDHDASSSETTAVDVPKPDPVAETSSTVTVTAANDDVGINDTERPAPLDINAEAKALEAAASKSSENEPTVSTNVAVALIPPTLLRILVFGSPFAGKKTHATRLAERFSLALLSVHALLEAVLESDSELGVEARQLLQSGQEISPWIYSRLVADAVAEVERAALAAAATGTELRPASADSDTDKQPQPQPQQHVPVRGWIVYDLPGTEAQGRDLEELLTGFVDPARVPSPFDHESLLAPGYAKPLLPPTFLHGKSGVDLVFSLESSCASAIERCLGQLEDSATHETYHVVTHAPPRDATLRHRLVHANASLTCSELVSLAHNAAATSAQTQTRWFEQFATLRSVCTTHALAEETHVYMAACVDAFYAQQHETAECTAHDRETRECDVMRAEEQTQQRLFELESAISSARDEHAKCQTTLHHAEEAKVKKEELAEHRLAVDAAQKLVDAAVHRATDAALEDRAFAQRAREQYSGRLTPALSAVLATLWDDLEREYVDAMVHAFTLQREQRRRTAVRAKRIIDDVCAFVRRPDASQRVVNTFQARFNAVVDEMRFDDATKLELHARTDDLQDELAQLVDARAAENDDELRRVFADGWLEDTCQCIAVVFQAALQSECDRFVGSFQLLVDGFAAASSTVASALEHVRGNTALLDVSCRLFFDATAVVEEAPAAAAVPVAPVAPTPAAHGKGAAKPTKGKAAASTAAAAVAAAAAAPAKELDTAKEGSGDPMALDDLLAAYDRALLKCDAIAQLVTSKLDALAASSESSLPTDVSSANPTDVCTANLLRGVRYEHALLERRVAWLRDAAQRASDHVKHAMRSVELVLRDVVSERRAREQAAVAALVQYVHQAIEAEVDLPHYIDVQPELLYRFPVTVQLREDTLVRVNRLDRLVAPAPVAPLPVLEPTHRVRLNDHQRQALAQLLRGDTSSSDSSSALPRRLVPITDVVETLQRAAAAGLLPRAWRCCAPHTLAQVASAFLVHTSSLSAGLVDVDALLTALGSSSDSCIENVALLAPVWQAATAALSESTAPVLLQEKERSDRSE